MSPNPYEALPPRAFWKTAVAGRSVFDLADIWTPKFRIAPDQCIVTFGSCFAQHIGRALKERGFAWHDAEPAPEGLSPSNARTFNYGIFSARTCSIHTSSLLLQWTHWALGISQPPGECWEQDGRYYDPFRPAIEPNGFASEDEMSRSRQRAIAALAGCIRTADLFIFTMGLTESWWNRKGGHEYPMCPGTVAGNFEPSLHVFRNQDFPFVSENLGMAIDLMREINPRLRFLLTVSPVPPAATMSGSHALTATIHSKSTLRSVAGHLAATRAHVDYFPSYELIGSVITRGIFHEPDLCGVSVAGVAFVMGHFFGSLEAARYA